MNAPNLSTTAAPAWTSLARDLIERLRLHHAGHSRLLSNAPEPEDAPEGDDSPMSLEDAFARLSGNKADATDAFSLPVAPIPTPELLMIIRIAAAFGSAEAIRTARQSGAGTILRDIPAADLGLLTDALAHCWPGADWHVLFPTLDAGTVSKAAEGRFHRAIEERLDRIAPWIVLLPTVSSLPPHLLHLGLTDIRLPPVDRDIGLARLLWRAFSSLPVPFARRRWGFGSRAMNVA